MSRTLVGSQIRTRREALGLRQKELAHAAGVSPSYLNLIEHNRRGIGGKVLIDLAAALGVEVSALSEDADHDLLRALESAASAAPESAAELARGREFVARFPGWARLLAALQNRTMNLQQTVDTLSDRLAQDPFLAESLHEILSSVTAIHATSSILAESREMDIRQQRRFQTNLHQESSRLSDLSQEMVRYFDTIGKSEPSLSAPIDEMTAFFAARDFSFPEIETADGDPAAVASAVVAGAAELRSRAARIMTAGVLKRVAVAARRMPGDAFAAQAGALGHDPLALARTLGAPLDAVFLRLAFRSRDAPPVFGLIVCDGSGAVMLRKDVTGFVLPRYAPACALWPLYQALARPYAVLREALETPERRHFRAWAQAVFRDTPAPGVAPVVRAAMLLRAESAAAGEAVVAVGPTCRICPRADCAARREPSIHDPAD